MRQKFTVEVKPKAQKQLDKLPVDIVTKIYFCLEKLSLDPYIGKALSGNYDSFRSYRVEHYRILYAINDREIKVLVIRVAHRKDIYK